MLHILTYMYIHISTCVSICIYVNICRYILWVDMPASVYVRVSMSMRRQDYRTLRDSSPRGWERFLKRGPKELPPGRASSPHGKRPSGQTAICVSMEEHWKGDLHTNEEDEQRCKG